MIGYTSECRSLLNSSTGERSNVVVISDAFAGFPTIIKESRRKELLG
jgi:hypothetical protein